MTRVDSPMVSKAMGEGVIIIFLCLTAHISAHESNTVGSAVPMVVRADHRSGWRLLFSHCPWRYSPVSTFTLPFPYGSYTLLVLLCCPAIILSWCIFHVLMRQSAACHCSILAWLWSISGHDSYSRDIKISNYYRIHTSYPYQHPYLSGCWSVPGMPGWHTDHEPVKNFNDPNGDGNHAEITASLK